MVLMAGGTILFLWSFCFLCLMFTLLKKLI
jgi:hypothetical protein